MTRGENFGMNPCVFFFSQVSLLLVCFLWVARGAERAQNAWHIYWDSGASTKKQRLQVSTKVWSYLRTLDGLPMPNISALAILIH